MFPDDEEVMKGHCPALIFRFPITVSVSLEVLLDFTERI